MKTRLRSLSMIAVVVVGAHATAGSAKAQTQSELDAYWAKVSLTVKEGDFEGYAALYHEDAILVTGSTSYSIAQALDRWEQDFINAKSGATKNAVDFRLSMRLNDETTAHETGIFRYSLETASGDVTTQHVHFEALLVKKTRWLMLMEHQLSEATEAEWNALSGGDS